MHVCILCFPHLLKYILEYSYLLIKKCNLQLHFLLLLFLKKWILALYWYLISNFLASQLKWASRDQYLLLYVEELKSYHHNLCFICVSGSRRFEESSSRQVSGGVVTFDSDFSGGRGYIQRTCQSYRTLKNQNKSPLQDRSVIHFPLSYRVSRVCWNATFLIMPTKDQQQILCTRFCLKPLVCGQRANVIRMRASDLAANLFTLKYDSHF